MAAKEVLVEKQGTVAIVTINRPDKRNAQGLKFTQNMLSAFDEVENDPDVNVVILTGAGSVFGGGGDVFEIMSTEPVDPEPEFELIRGYNKVISRIYHFDRPIIAAVNGPAVGGGVCLALACDFAIAAEQAQYFFAFARIGLTGADMGAPFLLQKHLGSARASYYILTGETIDAKEGKALGLFVDVVKQDQLQATARRLAEAIAVQSRRGTTMAKLSLRRSLETHLDAALEYEAYLQSFAFQSQEHKKRLGEFIARRSS